MGEEDTYQDNSCSKLFNSTFRWPISRDSTERTEFRYAAVVKGVLMQEVLMISVPLSQGVPWFDVRRRDLWDSWNLVVRNGTNFVIALQLLLRICALGSTDGHSRKALCFLGIIAPLTYLINDAARGAILVSLILPYRKRRKGQIPGCPAPATWGLLPWRCNCVLPWREIKC